ncbi:outer membrane beta-barrel protein [uncultured Cohaesibacter sp.]|uniref:outer membrane protein n=1 Tax=uncultured Cohaesibacter sp. TaxID=1002546 RepID=UPI002931C077|nr:outer membrane beta-barrel protein [uncultured Cohaesibacter sp.]
MKFFEQMRAARYKKTIASSMIMVALSSSAFAADLHTVFDTQSAYDWSGLYMGVQYGMGNGTINSKDGTNKTSFKFNTGDSSTGGVLAGWNFQQGNIVYGLEGGVSVNELKGNYSGSALPYQNNDYVWHAEARGRLGYSFGRFLPYVSAGLLAGEYYVKSGATATGSTADIDGVFGYTAGAGVDVRIAQNFSLRSEYIYQNYGKSNYQLASGPTTLTNDYDVHIARAALLYHFGNPMQADADTMDKVLFAGPSLGLNVGFSTGKVKLDGYSDGKIDLATASAGAKVGYLYPIGNFRLGAEAELVFHNGTKSTNPSGPVTDFSYRLMWHSALRAKAGYAFDRFMPYVLAGANLAQFVTEVAPSSNTNLDPFKHGFSFGGGLEYAITDRISADLGYTYNNYDSFAVETGGSKSNIEHDFHQVRLGVVFR